MRIALVLALVLAPAVAAAQALAPARDGPLSPTPAVPAVAFTQRLDARLPMDAAFTDGGGHAIRLADEFPAASPRPVLLMLGYHRCPQLCGLAMHGVLESLHATGLPASAARIVFVSVDPAETAADAAALSRVDADYARFVAGTGSFEPVVARLVGSAAGIAGLASAVGFDFRPGDAAARFAHPAGLVVVTPDGHVSRYLMGVRFDAGELRDAIATAAQGRIGTLTDRLALLCAHLDPRVGAHSDAVLVALRGTGLATLALLALFAWRHREPR